MPRPRRLGPGQNPSPQDLSQFSDRLLGEGRLSNATRRLISQPMISFPRPAPTHLTGVLRQLGPGLIISAIIVGSGELIVTPKLGATVGIQLLWFIVLWCLIKVFVQIELGRFTISQGVTTLEALNQIPGPRLIVSWLVWLWVAMYLCLIFQVAGMVGGLAEVFRLAGVPITAGPAAVAVGMATAIPLVIGRYRIVEWFSTALVAIFTCTSLAAVWALQQTPYALTAGQIAEGLKFHLPGTFTTAFAAF